jgi:diguanylate cyclase (GGDEF)-like protein
LSSELQRTRPTSVLYCDLDNFKAVNDTRGHAAGDQCIATFHALAAAIVEGRGRVYRRYNRGDEFVVVLPNFSVDEAKATAERIRSTVESNNIGDTVPVTVSLGICTGQIIDALDLINRADKAMLRAKQRKNAVESPEEAATTTFPSQSPSTETASPRRSGG